MYALFRTPLSLALVAVTAGCMSAPTGLDLSLTRATDDRRFVVTLQPPSPPAALQQLHSWQVQLASPTGQPVAGARLSVDGGMPQHGHGLPTRPQVRPGLSAGSYVIEGVKFSMTGWWEIKLAIDTPQGADRVTFNTVVSEPGVSR